MYHNICFEEYTKKTTHFLSLIISYFTFTFDKQLKQYVEISYGLEEGHILSIAYMYLKQYFNATLPYAQQVLY